LNYFGIKKLQNERPISIQELTEYRNSHPESFESAIYEGKRRRNKKNKTRKIKKGRQTHKNRVHYKKLASKKKIDRKNNLKK
jgi:hypothetical protein